MPRSWPTRAETGADHRTVRQINLAAFGRAEEADLVQALRRDEAWIDGLSLLALEGDGIPVGHVLLTRCHIGSVPALCLAPCAVLPSHQGTGVGSELIRAVLGEARGRGERYVTVLGHGDYYPRFGFARASGHGIGVGIEVPDEALMVMSLDGSVLPTGTISYPPPFGI